jgi:hypothetical protein
MDPQVSTSFIPKEALTAQKRRQGGMGLVGLIALFIFILSIVAAGAAFGYKQLLAQQIAGKQNELKVQQGAFDPATIQDLLRLDSRIEQAKVLLQKHVAPSAIFDFLSQNTLVNVQFTSFDYSLNADGSATVQLDGLADSFSTVALQSDELGKQKALKDVIFSGITIDTTGHVSFVVHATVDPSLISYSNFLAASPATPVAAPQTQTQTTDTTATTTQ